MVLRPRKTAMALASIAVPSRPKNLVACLWPSAKGPVGEPLSHSNCQPIDNMNLDPNQNHRILIIDDNKAIHEDFRKILCASKAAANNLADVEAALFDEVAPKNMLPTFQIDSAFQ